MALYWCVPAILMVLTGPMATQGVNQQLWSRQTYEDEPYTFYCVTKNVMPQIGDKIEWSRVGHDSQDWMTSDHYEFKSYNQVPKASLQVKRVTEDTRGIYICEIKDGPKVLDSLVMGLNVGPHLYHDDIDKWRENIIIGVIAGGCMLFFLLCVCLINHFRYLSEESLDKRRWRKEERARRKYNADGVSNPGFKNGGSELSDYNNVTVAEENDDSYIGHYM